MMLIKVILKKGKEGNPFLFFEFDYIINFARKLCKERVNINIFNAFYV